MADQTGNFLAISSQDFAEKVLGAEQLVIVNFTSDTSDSCQIFEPEFAAISQEYQKKNVSFARVDINQNGELIQQQKIDGIPTLVFFKDGREINRIKGVVMRDKLRRQIEGALLVSSSPKSEAN